MAMLNHGNFDAVHNKSVNCLVGMQNLECPPCTSMFTCKLQSTQMQMRLYGEEQQGFGSTANTFVVELICGSIACPLKANRYGLLILLRYAFVIYLPWRAACMVCREAQGELPKRASSYPRHAEAFCGSLTLLPSI